MTRASSKPVPTSIRAALEQDKQAAGRHRLNVERMAELQAVTPALLYKWLEQETMPVNRLAGWFHMTRSSALIRFLAAQAGGVFIQVPTGRHLEHEDVHALQKVLNDAVGALLAFTAGKTSQEECIGVLLAGMESLAWHRENVARSEQPELEFD